MARYCASLLAFVAGFTVVFMLMGAGAGGVGRLLVDYRHELTIVAGVFIVLSGLVVAGLIPVPERAMTLSPRAGGLGGAFVTGAAVAIGWTPCVGYVLGAILTLAGSGHGAWQGALLLLVYSAGLAVPFLLAALAFDRVAARLDGRQAALPRRPGGVRRYPDGVRRAGHDRPDGPAERLVATPRPGRPLGRTPATG